MLLLLSQPFTFGLHPGTTRSLFINTPSSLLPSVGVFLSDLKDQTIGKRTETGIRVEWNRIDWGVMGWRRMEGDEILGIGCIRKGGKSVLVYGPKPFLVPTPMTAS